MEIKKNKIPVKCDGCSTDCKPNECFAISLSRITLYLCELCARKLCRDLPKSFNIEE